MKLIWIRRIAIALGVLVLLVLAGAVWLVSSFDANQYKPLAIDWMKAERQRTLAIDGPIELSLFPRLAVKVSKVRLSERGRAEEFLALDEAALAVQVLPLLHKELVVDRVSARGVRVQYTRDAKGARNIDDLVTGAGSSPGVPGPGARASAPALRLDVNALKLEDLQLRLRDDMAQLAGEVAVQSFSSGRLAKGAEAPVTLRATLQLTQPQALKLALDGRATLSLDLENGTAAATGLKLEVQGDTAAVKALSLTLEGAAAWEGGGLRAGPLQVAIKSATLGASTLTPSTLQLKRLLFSSGSQKFELEALQLALQGRQGSNPFELALDWPQLAVNANTLQGSALSGRVKLSGANALAGNFSSGAPSGNFDALRLPALNLNLQGSAGARKVDAKLKTELLLRVGQRAAAFERIELNATLADPGLQPLQLSLKGRASANAQSAQWAFDGALNSNKFESSGQAGLGGAVPNFKAQARFDSLDLNKLLAADKPTTAASAPGPTPANTPVQLDGLNAVNGQFSVSAGALALRQYRVAEVKLDATLDKGLLRITRLAGRAWGGSVEGSGSADARGNRVALKLAANEVNVNAMLKDVAAKDLLEGTGRVVADLNSSGANIGELRSHLAGSAAVQLRNGAVKGVNLARALRQAKAALTLKQDSVSKASAAEKTDFSELSASARIASGVAQSDDLDLKSPFLRIGGAGRFDIGRGLVDYTARATVIGSAAGQDGAELAALRGVTVPVQLSGPFEAIDWKIQWSAVAAAAVENKLKDKLAEKLGVRLGGAARRLRLRVRVRVRVRVRLQRPPTPRTSCARS